MKSALKDVTTLLILLSALCPFKFLLSQTSSHPITLPDIVAQREITEQEISPNGRSIALVVKDANVVLNNYTQSLFLVRTDAGSDQVLKLLVHAESISNVRWKPDGSGVVYLSTAGKLSQVWQVSFKGGTAKLLFAHPENISSFEWSPKGNNLALISSEPVSAAEMAAAAEKGVYYEDRVDYADHVSFPFLRFFDRSWVKKPSRLWLYDLRTRRSKRLWEQKDSISSLAWAPDGQKIAVQVSAPITTSKNGAIGFNLGIGVVPIEGGNVVSISSPSGLAMGPTWSSDSLSLAFTAQLETSKPRDGFRSTTMAVRLDDGQPPVEMPPEMESSYGAQTWRSKDWQKRIAQVSGGDDRLTSFSASSDHSTVSCIVQAPMKAPEIGVLSLDSGRLRIVTRLNAAFDSIGLGEVSRMTWKNKYGYETNGFLIKPIGYTEGKRYPVLIILYGFRGEFITDAEWMTSYPAQVFAANGFAVLLMNPPKRYGWHYGNFEQFVFDQDYNALASIEAAVDTLTEKGIADPKRAGIMGWSYGSELTNLTLTHNKLFAAASASSGGVYNRGEYWLTSKSLQHYYEGIMGGSPYGAYDKRFDELSTAAHADRVSAPLLIEAPPGEMLVSLELYTALRRLGKPVEFVIYPDEGHIYSQPKHRLASMQRNLDWFEFWLQGKEDPDPGKKEQYVRWREMRTKLGKTE